MIKLTSSNDVEVISENYTDRIKEIYRRIGERLEYRSLLYTLHTDDLKTNIELVRIYSTIMDYDQSNSLCYKILAMSNDTDVQYNIMMQLIYNYGRLFKPYEALFLVEKCEKIMNDVDLKMYKQFNYQLMGIDCWDLMNEILSEIYSLDRKDKLSDQLFSMARYYLDRGEFHRGMQCQYHANKQKEQKIYGGDQAIRDTLKVWDGSKVDSLIMFDVGGIGDELVSMRFLKHVADLGIKPIWYTDRSGIAEIVRRNGYEAIMSLDGYEGSYVINAIQFIIDQNLVEKDVYYGPYITPTQEAIEKFKDCKGIGLRVSGSNLVPEDYYRCIPLDLVRSRLSGDVYSLHDDKELAGCIDMRSRISSIDDTLGLIWNLDVVVTSCTSVAHMAAAMGKRVIVFVPILYWYAWVRKDDRIYWYDSENVKVIYRKSFDCWDDVMEQLGQHLSDFGIEFDMAR